MTASMAARGEHGHFSGLSLRRPFRRCLGRRLHAIYAATSRARQTAAISYAPMPSGGRGLAALLRREQTLPTTKFPPPATLLAAQHGPMLHISSKLNLVGRHYFIFTGKSNFLARRFLSARRYFRQQISFSETPARRFRHCRADAMRYYQID